MPDHAERTDQTRTEQTPQVQPTLQPVDQQGDGEQPGQRIDEPAKLIRIAAMVNRLGAEAREVSLDEQGRRRLREIYERSISDIKDLLGPDLSEELEDMSIQFTEDAPTEATLRIAQAQLAGWLDGLFRGIQAAFTAQQAQAQRQLGQLRRQQLGAGEGAPTGQYL